MTTIEGGALLTSQDAEAKLVEKLRFHGIVRQPDGTRDVGRRRRQVQHAGRQCPHWPVAARPLDEFNAARRRLAARYFANLETDPVCVLPAHAHAGEEDGHSWNMFCILLPLDRMAITRKQFIDEMHALGIGIGISYEALHLTDAVPQNGLSRRPISE
jgi:dTDP-4-amino-4,6-dideoxygalactose transaminase